MATVDLPVLSPLDVDWNTISTSVTVTPGTHGYKLNIVDTSSLALTFDPADWTDGQWAHFTTESSAVVGVICQPTSGDTLDGREDGTVQLNAAHSSILTITYDATRDDFVCSGDFVSGP